MSEASSLLDELSRQGVELWLDGQRLRYRAPRAAMNAALLERLRRLKPELIELLAEDSVAEQRIPRAAVQERAPLTPMQQWIWRHYVAEGDQPTEHIWQARHIVGALDSAALQRALEIIVERHGSLRSRFELNDGVVQQRVGSAAVVPFGISDCKVANAAERQRCMALVVEEQQALPFDLANEPPLRAKFVRFASEDGLLVLTFHQIAFDGWSTGLFLSELNRCMLALTAGMAPVLEPPPIQYIDFAYWQSRWLATSVARRQRDFWCTVLAQPLELPRLPPARSADSAVPSDGFTTFNIDHEADVRALRQLAKSAGISLHSVALASLAVLVHAYTGQRDLVISVPDSGRHQAETAASIGCYHSPLPIRLAIAAESTFTQLCQQAHQRMAAARRNGEVPLLWVLERALPQLAAEPLPLLPFSCSFSQGAMLKTELGDAQAEVLNNGGRVGRHALSLTLGDFGQFFMVTLELDTERLDGALAAEIRHSVSEILPGLITRRDATVASLASAIAPAAQGDHATLGDAAVEVVRLRKGNQQMPPLICVCGLYLYQALARCMPGEHPVYGVFVEAQSSDYLRLSLTDIDHLETISVEEMARNYIERIRAIQPYGPYRLLGASFGGLLAYEIAQQLLVLGEEVASLVMLDTTAPNSLKRRHFDRVKHHLHNIRSQGRQYLFDRIQKRIKEVTAGDLLSADIVERMRTAETAEERGHLVRGEIYLRATQMYQPRPYPGVLGLVIALDNPYQDLIESPEHAWRQLASGNLMVAQLPGKHIELLQPPTVERLAEVLAAMMDGNFVGEQAVVD